MSYEKFVKLYVEYKTQRENGKVVKEYKATEQDIEAAKIAAQFPEHLLRAAVIMSAIQARKELREAAKTKEK